jgi:phosphohistidine phosphatase
MKTLVLVRHGKAAWRHQEAHDVDRPLKKRGVEESRAMAKHLSERGFVPNLMVHSPAKRAIQTANIFAEVLDLPPRLVQVNNSIYNASLEEVLAVILALPDNMQRVVLIGHDPPLTNATSYLTNRVFEKIPTAGAVSITFNVYHWNQITHHMGQVQFSISPKMLI